MISLRRISLGGGWRYLMESVAVGDGTAERPSSLAAYYAASGTPPGRFLGAGLADLGGGRGIEPGTEVSASQLEAMLATMSDPLTGEPVGATPKAPRGGAPVAGFDLTFSVPKSVSVAWALADAETRSAIEDCHREAVAVVLAYAERHVFRSRSGANGIVEEAITGVVATAFTHWTSRADDPQLHDHVVVWNRAKSVSDGVWRTLDSRALFKATTLLSELHQGVLTDLLTARLGVGWEARDRRHSTRHRHEIAGVPEALMATFSKRATQVAGEEEQLVAAFVAAHGRHPSASEAMRLRQRATVATREKKTHRSLDELAGAWRDQAAAHIRGDQVAFVESLRGRNDTAPLRADDLGPELISNAARAVVEAVSERQATFGHHHVAAEAHRVLQEVRFVAPEERVAAAERITAVALERCLALTPPVLHHTPADFLAPDGSSRLRPRSRMVWTTQAVLDAEERLLDAARRTSGPTVSEATVARVTRETLPGKDHGVSLDQAVAVEAVACSGRSLDVLVGPAGTGKTTTMAALRAAWEAEHGPGSVIGLAPSAAAAEVLGDELGIATENTAKWLVEHRRLPELVARRARLQASLPHRHPSPSRATKLAAALAELDRAIADRRLRSGQLVIVDEASLAGTFVLDEIAAAARDAGAKVLLVGDPAQLSAVDAGGAFGLLVAERGGSAPMLESVRRFEASWEAEASVALRAGRHAAIDAYAANGRIFSSTDREALLDQLHEAWRADEEAGLESLMIAPDTVTVAELNRRARQARVEGGQVKPDGVRIADGQIAGVGDVVVTRKNDRLLATGARWVKNGDRWVVTSTRRDGSLVVRRAKGGGELRLPAEYVAQHVELGYAQSAHRAQGRTVDTAHALVDATTTREVLYVASSRGRQANRLYVDLAADPDPATSHDGLVQERSARDVLLAVLDHVGAERSAHETLRDALADAERLGTLLAEHQVLAQAAQAERVARLLQRGGLDAAALDEVRRSPAHGALLAALRRAEASGLDVEAALPRLVAERGFDDAGDIAAVLHSRVERWARTSGARRDDAHRFIAGLVPHVLGVSDAELARALDERVAAMERRARELAESAVAEGAPWVQRLGAPPHDPRRRGAWWEAVATVAAYRELWAIDHDEPLGPPPPATHAEELEHRERAAEAARRAVGLGRERPPWSSRSPSRPATEPGRRGPTL